ncbi:MAG TPA: DUF5916 domain-containing protein [Gemmatimonadales bacterium]|nr:DUF5916 domain-containing protein [Gemmatimonadales bacterium]
MIVAAMLAALVVQGARTDTAGGRGVRPPAPLVMRASQPPALDGKEDDAVWRTARAITDFQEWSPTEGAPARFRTEAKLAYDAANLYVFIRCFDPHPDSIIRQLARRDNFPASDRVIVILDSYADRRTGYEFGVNVSGVKADVAVYNDGTEDGAWDGVWDVATRVDSVGWTAEFRIPLSQIRYGPQREHTFRFAIDRDLYRYNERISWPLFRQSVAGMISQLADVPGFDDLEAPRRLEAAPYAVTKNISHIEGPRFGREQDFSLGADLKYRVASNLTLDATINPDFGQVEADPAVLNLTAFETFFPEQRPFFVAGRGVFQFDVNCNQVNCSGEGLFYSRRIGRAPELAGVYGDTTSPAFTTILGAGKLTGRLAGGLRMGLLEAVTAKMTGINGVTIEPATNYGILRLQQDYQGGNGTVGAVVTAVNRSLDSWSAPYLHRSAYVGAVDFRQRFLNKTYEVSGSLDWSRVAGSAQAIAATQEDATHYYQRPDAGLPLDTTRTVLGGDAQAVAFGKIAGAHLNFQTSYQRISPGFEINDLGYLQSAGRQGWMTWVGFFDRHVRKYYQSFQWNWNWMQLWTAGGLPVERAVNTNVHATLLSNWGVNFGGTWGQLGATYCDACARGGPAVRQDPYFNGWVYISADDRRAVVPNLNLYGFTGGAGHKEQEEVSPGVDLKFSTRATGSLSLDWQRNLLGYQWYGSFTTAGTTHYTFAHLAQHTVGVTARFDYIINRDMTLQVYAQPFVSKGTFSDVRELSATPRATRYVDRYQPYADTSVTNHPGGFNFKQFRSNVVFRWEYRPGSTLFLVWTQGRQGSAGDEGTSSFAGDFRDLLRLRPDNTFLVKIAYWLNR